MARNWILNVALFLLFSCVCVPSDSVYDPASESDTAYTISSISYTRTTIQPYRWKYIRVELPQWFSKVTIVLQSDVDVNLHAVQSIPKSKLPVICFRDGSLPLPDNFDTTIEGLVFIPPSNVSVGGIQKLQGMDMEQCYPIQQSLLLQLTNDQISPGVWYIGLFNGIGPARTQGKMIIRSSPFSFMGSISIDGCRKAMMWGKDCNQSVNVLSCDQSIIYNLIKNVSTAMVSCGSKTFCGGVNESRVYSTVVAGMIEQITIMAVNATFNGKPFNPNENSSGIQFLCYARHGGVPSLYSHDYSGDITKNPLVIHSPKIGNWYFSVIPINLSKGYERTQDEVKVCYSMELEMLECPLGKTGPNCTWERYNLQTYIRRDSIPFESYYLPISEKISTGATYFPLGTLLSNSSNSELGSSWTYFQLDVPPGAAGGNIHIQLTADAKMNSEIYARFGGLPTLNNWDYYYASKSKNSHGSPFFQLYHSSEKHIDFYILYPREGTWNFGVRHLKSGNSTSQSEPTMSFSLERCPKQCSYSGTCTSSFDASGLTAYSYCYCDRTHGGVDCSHEIISHGEHIWQSIFLITSNAAALLPAFWALKQKVWVSSIVFCVNQEEVITENNVSYLSITNTTLSLRSGWRTIKTISRSDDARFFTIDFPIIGAFKAFAEWVLFTSSGISSGLYHSCDVGTWCVLKYEYLQFMDFWLSFMAVISTFVHLATIDEANKRAIQTAVSILTALLAVTNATRSSNVVLVIAIGTVGLLVGWMAEFSSKFRSNPLSRTGFNMHFGWQTIQAWFGDNFKKLLRHFRWAYVVLGFIVLVMAGMSWIVETSETYWLWHSFWHMTIYTSSFLFLCSKRVNNEIPSAAPRSYELTRQDSSIA